MSYQPKVIVFDALGTLVKIGESRSPYRKLMKWLKKMEENQVRKMLKLACLML